MPHNPQHKPIFFGCGEYVPGRKPPDKCVGWPNCWEPPVPPDDEGDGGEVPTVPPDRPRPDKWICICEEECPGGYETGGGAKLCSDANSRRCVSILDPVVPGLPPGMGAKGQQYNSKAECEKEGFGKAPCWICGWQCRHRTEYCVTPPNHIKWKYGDCIECPPAAWQPCQFNTWAACKTQGGPGGQWCEDIPGECPKDHLPPKPGGGTYTSDGWRCEVKPYLCDPTIFTQPVIAFKVECIRCSTAWKKANPKKANKCRFVNESDCKKAVSYVKWQSGRPTGPECMGMYCPDPPIYPPGPEPTPRPPVGPYTGEGKKWECVAPGDCKKTSQGTYTSWSACMKSDECQMKWECINPVAKMCKQTGAGTHDSLADCLKECTPGRKKLKWGCVAKLHNDPCREGDPRNPLYKYDTHTECIENCKKYGEPENLWGCVLPGTGDPCQLGDASDPRFHFASWAECMADKDCQVGPPVSIGGAKAYLPSVVGGDEGGEGAGGSGPLGEGYGGGGEGAGGGAGGGGPPPQTRRLVAPQVINITDMAGKARVSTVDDSQSILHPYYNFFGNQRNTFNLVQNTRYLNIFKDVIPDSIDYILNHVGSTEPWSEYYTVNTEMLEAAIHPKLLESFSNIHDEGGFPIDSSRFYNTVYKAMITDSLDSFDPDVYHEMAANQSGDRVIEYVRSTNQETNQQAALGLASASGISADPGQNGEISRHALERSKPLAEEVLANSLAVSVRDNAEYTLPMKNAGLPSTSIVLSNTFIDFGEGSNYYFPANSIVHGEIPYLIDTALSSAYYLGAAANSQIMNLLGGDSSHKWSVTSEANKSEFSEDYRTDSSDSEALFFKLNVCSIENQDTQVSEDLISQQKATYNLITDTTEMNKYMKNFGVDIQRVRIDFDDPFYVYLKDSGEVDLTKQNLSFKSFSPPRGPNYEQFLLSNLPRGVLFVPGKGSRHNSFGSKSKLQTPESLTTSTQVTRIYTTKRSLDSERRKSAKVLEEKVVYDDFSTPYIGLMEKQNPDFHRVYYQFDSEADILKDTYYINGSYTSTPPEERERPAGGKMIRVVENLKAQYNLADNTLTFWDILRRLPYSTYIQLSMDDRSSLYTSLKSGGWGVKVRDVLNRAVIENSPGGETGILSEREDLAVTPDTVYLNKEDREENIR